MNVTIILSGGSGARFGSDTPKQYHKLCGRDVIAYPIAAAQQSQLCNHVIVAAHKPYIKYLDDTYGIECCQGGATHNETVANALRYVADVHPDCCHILFADSARPLVTSELLDKYFIQLEDFDAVITTQKITDSLGKDGEQFVDRTGYYLIQKPEAFRFAGLSRVFDANSTATAIVQQLQPDARIDCCFDMGNNIKVTLPEDIAIAEALLSINQGLGRLGGSI